MIDLRFKGDFSWVGPPVVLTLLSVDSPPPERGGYVASIEPLLTGGFYCRCEFGTFSINPKQLETFEGDIVLCIPKSGRIERLFRANSKYNSLTLTERCDQYCLMCSQPPRDVNDSWRFPHYAEAIRRLPSDSWIVLSGGEPTLFGDALLDLLEEVADNRQDLNLHILSNAQHFQNFDLNRLRTIHSKLNILWGIPLYAPEADLHDQIVDKQGAFNRLLENLYALSASGAVIELRTVVTALNVLELPALARFIATHLEFISYWAVMAMEPVGFAKANIDRLWFDHSLAPFPIHATLDLATHLQIDTRLYNFPRCTLGERYRDYCEQSISDWKRKYLSECGACEQKESCCGFFEWYTSGWERVTPLERAAETQETVR